MPWEETFESIAKLYGVTVEQQKEIIDKQEKKITSLEEENMRLRELLNLQLHQRFGKSNEASDDTTGDKGNDSNNNITVAAHTRKKKKKKGRLLSTEHLPSFQKCYDLPEDERRCDKCQGDLHFIKRNLTQQLEIIPVRYCVVEHMQFIYGCRCCNTVITPPKPQPPIPKAIAGASLLTDIIINKYQAHQPLYRQSKMLKNQELIIPDNTLGNWVVKIGFALQALYEALWQCILKTRYLQVDETPVKLLEPNKKGYLWTYYAPNLGNKRGLLAFELSETRAKHIVNERLKNFNGLVQTDAYPGYQEVRNRKGIVPLGCFTHARRKFKEVIKITKDQHGIAAEMIERLKPLYHLENWMKAEKLSFHTRKRLRQKIARPIIKEIYHWLRTIKNTVLPKSKLGQAIQYTLNQWRYIVAYCRHGIAEIDTNDVENKIREIALGKKNWLFIGNEKTGIIHAIFFSLIISCVLNALNPRVYIHYVIDQVHALRRGEVDPMTLLPHTIDQKRLTEFSLQQLAFAKEVFNSS